MRATSASAKLKPPLLWPDIDLKRKVWTVPAIKTADDHNPEPFEIPLCDAAIDVLLRVETMKKAMKLDTDIVFPMVRPNGRCEPMTRGAMRELIAHEQCGFTVHGMRTSFRTWAGEKTSAQRDVIETVLAHKVFSEDKAEAAYKSKTTFFEKRRDADASLGRVRHRQQDRPAEEGCIDAMDQTH